MPRSLSPRRIPSTRLLLEHLEDRNLFDVAMGSLLGGGLVDPLAELSATHDINGLPLGRRETGQPVTLRAGSELLHGTRNGSVVTLSNTGENETTSPTVSGHPDSSRSEPLRPSATTMTGSVQMSWLGENRRVIPGSWVVQVNATGGFVANQASSFSAALDANVPGLQVTNQVGNGWYRISAPSDYSADAIATAVGQVAPVLSMHPVFADYSVSTIPNDPYFVYQDSLHNLGNSGGLSDADIDAPETWSYTGPDHGSTSVVVAVNDTGVDYTHPDLYRNIWINQSEIPSWVAALDTDGDGIITFWDLNDPANDGVATDLNGSGYIDAGDILVPDYDGGWADGVDNGANGFTDDLIGWDFANGDNDPYDDNAHGTHVAGTIGAIGNNGVGVAGVVWKTQLMITAGLNWEGWGTDVDLAAAITYSVDNGARVTNASWGGEYSSLIDAAVAYAGAADHLVVAAAGNDFNDNDTFPDFSYPASLPYDNILSVGATDFFDYPTWFTNYGATSVDLMAPGDFVLSTVPTWYWNGYLEPGYEWFGGTSMAAPHVAGAAAMLWANSSSASLGDIRSAILDGVDYLPDLDPVTGYTPVASGGRLNLFGALQQLRPGSLLVVSTTPTEGETVYGSTPSEYVVTFNSAVQLSADPSDLQASDLLVNGVPGTSVTLSPDGLTATFTFASDPITTEGLETMQIAAGSVRRIDTNGTMPGTYESSFRYDSVQLEVIGVDPPTGSILESAGSYTFRYYFNEEIDPASFYPGDEFGSWWTFLIENNIYGHFPSHASEVPGNNAALDVTYVLGSTPNYSEGILEVYFSAYTVTDVHGNRDWGNQLFSEYIVDVTTRPYTVPVPAFSPLGSLTAGGATLNGYINPGIAGGDSDNFTVTLDAGQSLTISVAPTTRAIGDPIGEVLRPRIEVYDSANILIGSADASAAGQRAVLQSLAVTIAGTYTMRVSGLGGTTGRYSFYAALNISLEEEQYLTFASNNSAATAQSINSSFIDLTTDLATASRGAVLGGIANSASELSTTIFSADFENGNNGFIFENDLGRAGYAPGLWNRTERRGSDPGHSTSHSFWYGDPATGNYQTGFAPNAGYLVSPTISLPSLPGSLLLDFNYYLRTEGSNFYDSTRVQVTTNAGVTWTSLNSTNFANTLAGWQTFAAVNLTPYKGQNVQFRFSFDTIDSIANAFEGWYVDDVRIYQALPQDYFSFSAKAGEKIGLAVTQFSGGVDPNLLRVELLASDGTTVLATGTGGSSNVAGAISGVTIPTTGTYYARITSPIINSGASGTVFYTFVVTRDAVFGLEPNNTAGTSQPLAGAKGALGYVETQSYNIADSGWYNSAGFHGPTNTNYFVGQEFGIGYRDWFVFDVPVVAGPITTARVELFNPVSPNPGYRSSDSSETYTLFDVSTAISTLRAGGSGLMGIYNDLGTGESYGSVTVTSASNGTLVVINLNAAGLSAVAAKQGGQLALGGAITTISGTTDQYLFGFTSSGIRRLVINNLPFPAPSDWYSVTLAGDQTSLQVETRTPGDGPGEIRNTLNPRIEVYNATGTTLIASGTPLADGRNEKILVTGLTPGATYQVRIFGEGGTVGEYFMSATPLRVPTITSMVDDGFTNTGGPDGEFHITNPDKNGWTNVTGSGWQNDYTFHQFGVNHTPNNEARWKIRATSSNPELFVTWVPLPGNATNATYQVFKNNTLLATVVVNQQVLPNDGVLFGNTYVESLGSFSGIVVNSLLTVKLLTEGANGNVVADGVFDPPTGEELSANQLVPGEELQAPILSRELQQIGSLSANAWLTSGSAERSTPLESRTYSQVWRERSEVDEAFVQQYQSVSERAYGGQRIAVDSLLADAKALPFADQFYPFKRSALIDSFDFETIL